MSLSRFLAGFLVALIIITSPVQSVVTSTPALLFITTSQAHFIVNNSPAQLVVTAIPNRVLVVAPLSINRNTRSINSEGKLARSALTDLPSSTVLTPSTLSSRHSSRSKPDCLVRCILVIPCWSRHGNVEVRSVGLSSMSTPPQKFSSFRVSMKVKMSPLSDCSTGTTRVHLAQSSDVVLKLRTLFVQPSQVSKVCSSSLVTSTIPFHGLAILFISAKSKIFKRYVTIEIHLVSSGNLIVGTRAGLARSASFQTLLFRLFNVDSDYSVLVVVTYSGMHLMISHGSPVVEQVLVMLFCFCIMLFIKLSRIPPFIILLPLSTAPDVIV
ncbi:hypothetical protein IGI04_037087 [Brassica rapa subsp. trilocularis]|uniref:Uncharacterized protein n=1 Tax=Brassica rapa subsp. trilocularis TaxID=1813537 RepID=A0ABQ7LH92_BRACM|nr:hypothetical protein IGI04_037087 [Brassica rapa subsp. trilocularis]